MANTVYGPYTPTTYSSGVTPLSASNLNTLGTQAGIALNGFNGDLIGAGFVLSGVTCAKDGTTASQLDVASGRAYALHSDGSVGLIVVGTTTFSAASYLSATVYLDLNPDGTWSWGASHSAVANHLTICTVTTDGSGNISAVTDTRPLDATLLSTLSGVVRAPSLGFVGGGQIDYETNLVVYRPKESGATAQGHIFQTYTGSTNPNPFGVGAAASGALTSINDAGAIASVATQTTAGSFGVPVIVAQALNQTITVTSTQTLATFTPPTNGLYMAVGYFVFHNGSNTTIFFYATYTDPVTAGNPVAAFNSTNGWTYNLSLAASGGTSIVCTPVTFYAKGGQPITLNFHDNAGTPNDTVSMMLWRLS